MLISESEILEFIKIYREELDEDISMDEASEIANRLINLYEILLRLLPDELKNRKNKKRRESIHPPDHGQAARS